LAEAQRLGPSLGGRQLPLKLGDAVGQMLPIAFVGSGQSIPEELNLAADRRRQSVPEPVADRGGAKLRARAGRDWPALVAHRFEFARSCSSDANGTRASPSIKMA